MSAATLATTCATAASGSGSAAPSAMAWDNLYGQGGAQTQTLTVAGITGGPAALTATNSGTCNLYYTLNGNAHLYTGGSFNVSNGDTLSWTVNTFSTSNKSGTVTVKAAGGAFTVGSFTWVLTGNTL